MSNTFFIAGTDTDAGKTLVATALLVKARQLGLTTLGLKPLAAGGDDQGEGVHNEDAMLLQQSATLALSYRNVNPVVLREPMAPHIAADREGLDLSAKALEHAYHAAFAGLPDGDPDFCVVEGAGGWRVPLNASETVADFVKRVQLPVILVVGVRLGCLNHALLTAEAIERDGLSLAAWVATQTEPAMTVIDENLATLRSMLPAPCLGYVPWLEDANAVAAAPYLDLGGLELGQAV